MGDDCAMLAVEHSRPGHVCRECVQVEMCKRVDKHDREQCPYAHPGELARRRHPSLYQALPCPEARAVSLSAAPCPPGCTG